MLGNLFRPWCEQRDQLLVGGDQPPVSDSSTSSSSSSNSSSSSPSRITDNDNDGDMTGEDEAASGFSSHSSSMAAMMPDEEDEEEPIFEEDTAIGTSAGSCVDPPAEEGQGSPFEPGELTVSERAALEAQLLPYLVSSRFSDLRRLLEEAGWPAACYNALEHVQVAGSLKESSDQQRPSTEEAAAGNEEEQEQSEDDRDDDAGPEAPEGGKEEASPQGEQPPPTPPPRALSLLGHFPCPLSRLCSHPTHLPRRLCLAAIAYELFGHYEHTVYDGGEQAYNFADESKAERAEVEYDARWVRKLALPEGTRLCFLRAAMGLGKSEAFVRLLLGIEGVNVDEFFSAQELQALSTLRRARDRVFRCLMIGPRVTFDASLHHRLELALRQADIEIAFYQDLTKKASSQPARTGKRPCEDPNKMGQEEPAFVDYSQLRLPPAKARHEFLLSDDLQEVALSPTSRQQLDAQKRAARTAQTELQQNLRAANAQRLESRTETERRLLAAYAQQQGPPAEPGPSVENKEEVVLTRDQIAAEAARLSSGLQTQEERESRNAPLSQELHADKKALFAFAAAFPNLRPDWETVRACQQTDFVNRCRLLKLLRQCNLQEICKAEHKPGFVALFDQSKVTLPLASAVSDPLSALTLDLGSGAPSQRLQLTTLELNLAKITHYLRRILQTLPRVVAKWKPSAYVSCLLNAQPHRTLPLERAMSACAQLIKVVLPCQLVRIVNPARHNGQFKKDRLTFSRYELVPDANKKWSEVVRKYSYQSTTGNAWGKMALASCKKTVGPATALDTKSIRYSITKNSWKGGSKKAILSALEAAPSHVAKMHGSKKAILSYLEAAPSHVAKMHWSKKAILSYLEAAPSHVAKMHG
eukprot:g885.t1